MPRGGGGGDLQIIRRQTTRLASSKASKRGKTRSRSGKAKGAGRGRKRGGR